VRAWDPPARQRFADACVTRAARIVAAHPDLEDMLAVIKRRAAFGNAPAAGYFAAMRAGGDSVATRRPGPEYERDFQSERQAQARWLQDELGLHD